MDNDDLLLGLVSFNWFGFFSIKEARRTAKNEVDKGNHDIFTTRGQRTMSLGFGLCGFSFH